MPPSFTQFQGQLLIALVRADEQDPGGIFDLKKLADQAGFDYRPGWVAKAAQAMVDRGQARKAFHMGEGPDGGYEGILTGEGLEEAERLIAEHEAFDTTEVPASDRFVRIDHNSAAYVQMTEKLDELIEAVRANNRYATDEQEDQEQRLAELESGRTLLQPVRVRIGAISEVLVRVITDLAKKFRDAAIGQLATATLNLLKTLLGL